MKHPALRVLAWHEHGNYLYYLTQVPVQFILPFVPGRSPGYGGRCGSLPWGANVVEVPAERLRDMEFDCVLHQSRRSWEIDQHQLLSHAQRRLPRIYLEHDPPQGHPTDTRHFVDDPMALVVHVTAFNRLMWDNGTVPTRIVEHGVLLPEGVRYVGDLARGIAVVNHLARRGRRLGADVFAALREQVPLDLVGMKSELSWGLGEIPNTELPGFMARYRFYFHPVRWTSLGLSLVEAMMIGMPIVGLATTELATVIRNGESGYIDTAPARLADAMRDLIESPDAARAMGEAARREANRRFPIGRFIDDWLRVFMEVTQ